MPSALSHYPYALSFTRLGTLTGWVLAASLTLASPAWAQLPPPPKPSAAVVMALSGQAKAIDGQGRERLLEKGATLYPGDKIVTADASLVQVRLHDGGYMSVRPNTEMVIDQFVFDEKEPLGSRFLVSLVRGGFRSITGLIGRSNPNGYQIRSATATIGIRGTDHEPVVVLDTPEAQAQVQAPPGLYDKVNDGETFITSKGVVLPLKRGDVGFAPLNTNVPPQVLLKVPEFYKIDLKTDAREPRDGADGGKSGGNTGGMLRPSVSARREALGNGPNNANPNPGGGAADGPGAPAMAGPGQGQNPGLTAPAQAGTSNTSGGAGAGSGNGSNTPALTVEQRRQLGQAITNNSNATNTNNTTTATPTRADAAAAAPLLAPKLAPLLAPAPSNTNTTTPTR